jgi:hypothetical protein
LRDDIFILFRLAGKVEAVIWHADIWGLDANCVYEAWIGWGLVSLHGLCMKGVDMGIGHAVIAG